MVIRRLFHALRRQRPVAYDITARLVGYATWIPVAIFFNNWVAKPTFIKGGSMYPFFNEDRDETTRRDLALCWKSWGSPQYGLKKGMIVVFKSPMNPEREAVKRITATEGDIVMAKGTHRLVKIPAAHIWVEGDAGTEAESLDSNTYGPISVRLVTGRLTHMIYPFRKFGEIRWWEHPAAEGRPDGWSSH